MILEWPTPTVTEDFKKNDCQWREITEEAYTWFLECVPPIGFNGSYFVNSEPHTYNQAGEVVYLAFKEVDGKFYARLATLKQYKQLRDSKS
ncbi:MAG: hypothetical protein ACYTXA_05885 [Nostoc sp.]